LHQSYEQLLGNLHQKSDTSFYTTAIIQSLSCLCATKPTFACFQIPHNSRERSFDRTHDVSLQQILETNKGERESVKRREKREEKRGRRENLGVAYQGRRQLNHSSRVVCGQQQTFQTVGRMLRQNEDLS